jgi:hypothetical protein
MMTKRFFFQLNYAKFLLSDQTDLIPLKNTRIPFEKSVPLALFSPILKHKEYAPIDLRHPREL